jgi:signal transduction histidine kinase
VRTPDVAVTRSAAVAVTGFAVMTLVWNATHGAPVRFLVIDSLLGLLFVVAGVVASERRPEVPYGALLVLSGGLWFVGSWSPAGDGVPSLLGSAFERYYDIVLAWIALTFPGVPLTRWGRAVMGVLVSGFVARSIGRLLGPPSVEQVEVAASGLIVVASLGVAALAVSRLIAVAPAARPVLAPVVVAGVVAALVAAWDALEVIAVIQTGEAVVSLDEPWSELLAWSIIAAVALVPVGYLMGVLRLRRRRGPLAALAVELGAGGTLHRLQSALGQALGDRSVELVRWDRQAAGWVDVHGQPAPPPTETPGRAATFIDRDAEPVAAFTHDPVLREDPGLLSATAALLGLALDNARLAEEVRSQLEQVQASRARLVEAAEVERRRIERDLHDGAQQRLIGVALALQECRTAAGRAPMPTAAARQLDHAADEVLAALDELRELARGIHPAALTDEGLPVAVAGLARRCSVPVDLDVHLDGRLPAVVEATAYYVVAEALTNVVRHARARNVRVRIGATHGPLEVTVDDDGDGGAEPTRGSGLRGLADRLEAVGGTLSIDSPPQCGTRLTAVLPCA